MRKGVVFVAFVLGIFLVSGVYAIVFHPAAQINMPGGGTLADLVAGGATICTSADSGDGNCADNLGPWSGTGSIYYSGGNVGIGTSAPGEALSVWGSSRSVIQSYSDFGAQVSGSGGGHGVFGSNLYTDNANNYRTAGNHASYGYSAVEPSWGGIKFLTGSGATTADAIVTPTTSMIITSGGNVGIGTASPGARLEVAGQVKITGGSPGAGKVLTSDANGLASWQTPATGGDNLGNHIATQWLNMNGNYIGNVDSISSASGNFDVLYNQGNDFYIKSGTSTGGVYIGSGGNVPLYVSGRIMAPHEGIQFGENLYRVYAQDSTMKFLTWANGYTFTVNPGSGPIQILSLDDGGSTITGNLAVTGSINNGLKIGTGGSCSSSADVGRITYRYWSITGGVAEALSVCLHNGDAYHYSWHNIAYREYDT